MRTPARVLGLAVAFVVTFLAGSGAAWADQPVGGAWEDAPRRSPLELLLVFGGGTLGLIVVITLFALVTARRNFVPAPPGNEIQRSPDGTPAHH